MVEDARTATADSGFDVAIVGAGIAGLVAAEELAAAGHRVVVLDKGRGIGGRMATRRLGDAVFDHGAQFFTVRGRAFGGIVAAAHEKQAVVPWCSGFAQAESVAAPATPADDGHARWRGAGAMTDLPKFLAGRLIDWGATVKTAAQATAIAVEGARVRIEIDGAAPIPFVMARGCVVTAPVPQALALFAAGGLAPAAPNGIDAEAHRLLATVAYDPCFALMLALDGPGRVPPPGGIQFASGPITWIADNMQKGISPRPALTIHASGAFSRERFDAPPDEVARELRSLAAPWIGEATVVEQSLQRWKFATPTTILDVPLVAAITAPPIVCCGDAFAGPKVEGAASSGMAAGRWLDRILRGA
jgi:predicted NAD/FAD-dependent oxidoreductase